MGLLSSLSGRDCALPGLSYPHRQPISGYLAHTSLGGKFFHLIALQAILLRYAVLTTRQHVSYNLVGLKFLDFLTNLCEIQVFNLMLAAGPTHAWYKEQFKTYPVYRKALIPYIY